MELKTSNISKAYTPLIWLAVLYVSAMIIADVLTYNLISIFGVLVSTSLFIFPLTYSIGDITAESYGKKIALTLVIICMVGDFLFDTSLSMSSHFISSVNSNSYTHAYQTILNPLIQVFEGDFFGVLVSSIINVLLMVNLRKIHRFRHFIPRSIVSTFLGEISYTIIAYSIWFYNKGSIKEIIGMVAMSMAFKVIFAGVASIPSYFVAKYIKDIQGRVGLSAQY